MELRDIEYFAVVAEHAHVGRAAEALGLSQPALSKSLRRLEKAVQAKLVKRTPRGIELTAEGAALLVHVQRLRLSLEDVKHEIEDVSRGLAGHLRIGAGPGMVDDLLATTCSALLKEAPKTRLSVTVATQSVLAPALRNGQLDLIITTMPSNSYEDLVQEPLLEDRFVVFASARHALAGRRQLMIKDLVHERWAVATTNTESGTRLHRAFEDCGLPPPNVALAAASIPLKLHVVAGSDLLGFTSKRVLQQASPRLRLVELRVKEIKWHRRVAVDYRKDAYLPPLARRLIAILKATARDITAGQKTAVE
jgi:DNA-binding transcriptional LysR family regulator